MIAFGDALLGVVVGSALVYWFRLIAGWLMNREAMGEGDVILVGAIGAFLGWQGAVFSFFGGAVYGTLFVIPRMVLRRKPDAGARARAASLASLEGDEADELIASGADMGIPFGPWIALAGVSYLLVFKSPVDTYFARFIETFADLRGAEPIRALQSSPSVCTVVYRINPTMTLSKFAPPPSSRSPRSPSPAAPPTTPTTMANRPRSSPPTTSSASSRLRPVPTSRITITWRSACRPTRSWPVAISPATT